jgi:hypothetical protein
MKNLSIAALVLFSSSAFATDARRAAHQGNVGIKDDVDYRTFYSKTDNGKDSMWFDLIGGATTTPAAATDGGAAEGAEEAPAAEGEEAAAPAPVGPAAGVLSAAYKADGRSLTLQQTTLGSTAIGYYAGSGDTGYAVLLDVANKDTISIGGGYGMTNGKTDMAFGGTIGKGADSTDVALNVASRTLNKDDVSAWGADIGYLGKAITVDGQYRMGWRFKTDRSKAAVTLGPNVSVLKPEEGDMDIALTLAEINIAGEFALNDWFGLRGSVVSGLDAVIPMGDKEFDVMTQPVSPMFGASLDFEGADIDFTIDPNRVLDGPYFLTGAGVGNTFAAMMSARFDI